MLVDAKSLGCTIDYVLENFVQIAVKMLKESLNSEIEIIRKASKKLFTVCLTFN